MKTINILIDYKDNFGSKHFAVPYRSGFDKELIKKLFNEYGIYVTYMHHYEIDFSNQDYNGKLFVCTSSEDIGGHYKSYIEDIVYGLELSGAVVIPSFKYIRAHNNKVFMEILRNLNHSAALSSIKSVYYGVKEEFKNHNAKIEFPFVLKRYDGSSGRGIFLIDSYVRWRKNINKISRTISLNNALWDFGRSIRHKGYKRESLFRNKYVIQQYIPDLKNDWKVYVFGERVYLFFRPIFKQRGIRASGGGYDNYFYGENANAPDGLFDFANEIYRLLDTPHVSLDIGYDGKNFYLFEFQCLYFGTAGIPYSNEFFIKESGNWVNVKQPLSIEKVLVDSIMHYIEKKNL